MNATKIKIGGHYGYSRRLAVTPIEVEVIGIEEKPALRAWEKPIKRWKIRDTEDGHEHTCESRELTMPWPEQKELLDKARAEEAVRATARRAVLERAQVAMDALGFTRPEWDLGHGSSNPLITLHLEDAEEAAARRQG